MPSKPKNIPVFQIDRDVPVPDIKDRAEPIPLSTLEPGESILFPLSRRRTVQTHASRLKTTTGKVFTIKKVDNNNARIWRLQ